VEYPLSRSGGQAGGRSEGAFSGDLRGASAADRRVQPGEEHRANPHPFLDSLCCYLSWVVDSQEPLVDFDRVPGQIRSHSQNTPSSPFRTFRAIKSTRRRSGFNAKLKTGVGFIRLTNKTLAVVCQKVCQPTQTNLSLHQTGATQIARILIKPGLHPLPQSHSNSPKPPESHSPCSGRPVLSEFLISLEWELLRLICFGWPRGELPPLPKRGR
jgi:hypothetical protein